MCQAKQRKAHLEALRHVGGARGHAPVERGQLAVCLLLEEEEEEKEEEEEECTYMCMSAYLISRIRLRFSSIHTDPTTHTPTRSLDPPCLSG